MALKGVLTDQAMLLKFSMASVSIVKAYTQEVGYKVTPVDPPSKNYSKTRYINRISNN